MIMNQQPTFGNVQIQWLIVSRAENREFGRKLMSDLATLRTDEASEKRKKDIHTHSQRRKIDVTFYVYLYC